MARGIVRRALQLTRARRRKETAATRAEGDETDAEILADVEHRRIRLARHSEYSVCSAVSMNRMRRLRVAADTSTCRAPCLTPLPERPAAAVSTGTRCPSGASNKIDNVGLKGSARRRRCFQELGRRQSPAHLRVLNSQHARKHDVAAARLNALPSKFVRAKRRERGIEKNCNRGRRLFLRHGRGLAGSALARHDQVSSRGDRRDEKGPAAVSIT